MFKLDRENVIGVLLLMTLISLLYFAVSFNNFTHVLKEVDSELSTEPTFYYYVVEPKEISNSCDEVSVIEKEETLIEDVIEIGAIDTEPTYSDEEYLLAQIINAEAKGEPYEGKLAVGNVVLNRVESSDPYYPNTIEGVIFQKGQFSPVSDGSIHEHPNKDSLKAAKELFEGRRVLDKDVLFFYNPKIATNSWIFTTETVETIGNHVFAVK